MIMSSYFSPQHKNKLYDLSFIHLYSRFSFRTYNVLAVTALGLGPHWGGLEPPPLIFGLDIPYQHSCLRPPLKQKYSRANFHQLGKDNNFSYPLSQGQLCPFSPKNLVSRWFFHLISQIPKIPTTTYVRPGF